MHSVLSRSDGLDIVTGSHELDPFEPFKISMDGEISYAAGFPTYGRNFTRDVYQTGIITGRTELIQSQVAISTLYQGKKHDPHTGEMPGRPHHELEAVVNAEGRSMMYNACDTAGQHLIALSALSRSNPDAFDQFDQGIGKKHSTVERTVEHILSMVNDDDLYYERPPEGNQFDKPYLAHITYWKDSHKPDVNGNLAPVGNVAYALAHFITARGLLSASELQADPTLTDKAHKMFAAGIATFIRPDGFVQMRDDEGDFVQESSDELHALAYIPTEYRDQLPLRDISRRAAVLETEIGYVCTPEVVAVHLNDQYHGYKVWPVDGAYMSYGASKFGLEHETQVAARVAPHIGQGQELFGFKYLEDGSRVVVPEGNGQQLWSVGAKEYFNGRSDLIQNPWL